MEKITPSDVVLLNYILHLQRQLERQVLDLMTQTSQSHQCTRLAEVCARAVCVYGKGRLVVAVVVMGRWWRGGGGYPLSFDSKTEHFPRLICLTVIQIVETPNEMPVSLP